MKKHKIIVLFLFTAALSLSFLSSCETKDDNKMAGAQECMDDLKDTDAPAKAMACEDMISGITTPQSYVIRCSAQFFVGGITTEKILDAFEAFENASDNQKASVLIYALSQTDASDPNDNDLAIAQAEKTYNACKLAKSPSLLYIATASQTGTIIKNSGPMGCSPNCDGMNVTDDLNKCINAIDDDMDPMTPDVPTGGVCDDAAIGEAVLAMSESYCIGEATDNQVCTEIRSAVSAAGGTSDPAAIALALYQLILN
jgi:hypothetical protein